MNGWILCWALLACGGVPETTAPSGPVESVQLTNLTEPWSRESVPVGTAIIELSTANTLILRQPNMPLEMIAPSYSTMRTYLLDSGWSIEDESDYNTGTRKEQRRGNFVRGKQRIQLMTLRSLAGGVEIRFQR